MSTSRGLMGSLSWTIRGTPRTLSGTSMGNHSMVEAEFALSMLKEMTAGVSVTGEEAEDLRDAITEEAAIGLVEGKCLMESSREPTIAWWWKICPQEHLGRT